MEGAVMAYLYCKQEIMISDTGYETNRLGEACAFRRLLCLKSSGHKKNNFLWPFFREGKASNEVFHRTRKGEAFQVVDIRSDQGKHRLLMDRYDLRKWRMYRMQ